MDVRQIIRKEVFKILTESVGDINIAQQLVSNIKENGFEYIETPDIDFSIGKIHVIIGSNDKNFPYGAELYIDFDITSSGSYTPAVMGATVDQAIPPQVESPEWNMKLENAKVFGDDGKTIYEGKEAFLDFFKENYWKLKEHFEERMGLNESGNLLEFVEKEVITFHKKIMLESEKKSVENELKLLKEDDK